MSPWRRAADTKSTLKQDRDDLVTFVREEVSILTIFSSPWLPLSSWQKCKRKLAKIMSIQVLLQLPREWFMQTQLISSSAALSFSLPSSGADFSQSFFEMRKHILIIQLGRQEAGKAHFPRLHWRLSRWSWEMLVLAAATPVKETALGLPHSAEQGGSGFCLCTELPATG